MARNIQELESTLERTKRELAELRDEVGVRMRNGAAGIRSGAQRSWDTVSSTASNTVQERPLTTLLGAMAVGAAIGFLFRRR